MNRTDFLAVMAVFSYALKELSSETTKIRLESEDIKTLMLIRNTIDKAVPVNIINSLSNDIDDLLKEIES